MAVMNNHITSNKDCQYIFCCVIDNYSKKGVVIMRSLKVYSSIRYNSSKNRFDILPYIRLQGKWLDKLGFNVGRRIVIIEGKDEIILRLVKE